MRSHLPLSSLILSLPITNSFLTTQQYDVKTRAAFRALETTQKNALKLDIDEKDSLTYDENGPRVTFKGSKEGKVAVVEEPGARTLLEYLALPAEKYSVLDAGTIQRIPDSSSFVCELDPINFLGNKIIATIYADVNVSPYPEGKSVIEVTGCSLDGSKLARFANGSFDVKCTNVVRALREDFKGQEDVPVLSVDCNVEVSALVPREGRWLPKRLLSKSGSLVMQSMLRLMVPRFVGQLGVDFQGWSLGDDSRAPVSIDAVIVDDEEVDENDSSDDGMNGEPVRVGANGTEATSSSSVSV
mmetsp:Transcript_8495/g.12577  ORF Transcript_8495/g.12577 Transcript_8495/m.12577 type:complete len:300 (+) Transcript_8495:65-964(+)